MDIKKGFYRRKTSSHILEVVGLHESGDPLCNWIFTSGTGFRYHRYEFSKEMEVILKSEVDKLDTHTCHRRYTTSVADIDVWYVKDTIRKCSYCGSLHPMDLISIIKDEGTSVIEPSTKSYKWHVNSTKGYLKYYRQHDTTEFITEIIKLMK